MKSIADVNVLLPILCGGHPAQAAALAWFDEQPPQSVGWCLLTKLAILRHLTNPKIMGSDVQTAAQALAVWDLLANDERMMEICAIPHFHERLFRSFASAKKSHPNIWTDAWLAALADSLDREMVTFDQGSCDFPLTHLRLLKLS